MPLVRAAILLGSSLGGPPAPLPLQGLQHHPAHLSTPWLRPLDHRSSDWSQRTFASVRRPLHLPDGSGRCHRLYRFRLSHHRRSSAGLYRRRLAVTAGAEWRAVRQECLRDVLPDTVSGQRGEFYERLALSAAGPVQTAKQGLPALLGRVISAARHGVHGTRCGPPPRRTPPWLRFIARYRSSERLSPSRAVCAAMGASVSCSASPFH